MGFPVLTILMYYRSDSMKESNNTYNINFWYSSNVFIRLRCKHSDRKLGNKLNLFFFRFVWLGCFFQYKFIYFNCRLITLQYCIGFAIHQHESLTIELCYFFYIRRGTHVVSSWVHSCLLLPVRLPARVAHSVWRVNRHLSIRG